MAHQKEDDAVRLHVAASLLQPVVNVLEGAPVGDVEEEQPAHGVTVVGPCDGSASKGQPLSEQKVCSFHQGATELLCVAFGSRDRVVVDISEDFRLFQEVSLFPGCFLVI